MSAIDYILVAGYLVGVLWLGFRFRLKKDSTAGELIVGGRMLTLPAFVASMVSTWYGGILGVGEYTFTYGLSNWLVFGVPYYLAAILFALFLARRARQSEVLTIPDRLTEVYGRKVGVAGGVIIFLMTVPAAYVLMLGVLAEQLFGWPLWVGVVVGTLFSIAYVYLGGFRSVVRTDILQFGLMFIGFALLLIVVVWRYGGLEFLMAQLPAQHFTWHGGNSALYIAGWYFIALATLIEPAFFQRCYAARDARTAQRGIFVSIGCWVVFDFLTTSCGLYARAILPDLADPVAAYPALALEVLPAGLLGLFVLALMATVMSTVDSYSFLAATTFSRDIIERLRPTDRMNTMWWTRIGLMVAVGLAVVMALFFKSVIDIWHMFGSVGTPALLIPVFSSFVGNYRMSSGAAFFSILGSGSAALIWYLSQYWGGNGFWFGIEPIFPGLVVSLAIFLTTARVKSNSLKIRDSRL